MAFIRLFALFQYYPEEVNNTLVMLDESTSAVDTNTEGVIYQLLNDLHVWFVTISHRLSLMKYHSKELKLYSKIRDSRQNNLEINNDEEEQVIIDLPINRSSTTIDVREDIVGETQLAPRSHRDHIIGYIDTNTSGSWFKQFRNIWKLIHLPFGPDDRKLRIQVIDQT